MSAETVPVTGWGRTAPTAACLIRPRSYEEAVAAVRGSGARGGIPRGLGRAYGDAAQNAGGAVFDMTGLNRIHAIDAEGGTVLCDAGVSLNRLMEVLLPLGWFVPVTPGTRYVTVGGAIGTDVHGRNHHVSGSFSRHVLSFELLTADGEIRTVRRGTPLFDATTGGMGLTGMILTATVQLQPVETSLMSVDTERARDLDDLMARLTATDHQYRYSAAWVDLLARGTATGRAVLTRGDHAPLEALETPGRLARGTRARRDPLAFGTPRFPAPPRFLPEGLLHRTSVGLFNEPVPEGAPRAYRPAAGDLRVLPPPRRRAPLEPDLRPRRPRALPVRRRTGPGRRPAPDRAAGLPVAVPVPSRRAQAVRGRRPRVALLPGARLDPGPGHPGRSARSRRPPRRTGRGGGPGRMGGSAWPRTPVCGRNCSPRCTRASTTSVRCAPSWTRAGCSPRTCPAV